MPSRRIPLAHARLTSQPSQPAQIDWSNPITAELMSATQWNTGALYDAASQSRFGRYNASIPIVPMPSGLGIGFNGIGVAWRIQKNKFSGNEGQITIVAKFIPSAAAQAAFSYTSVGTGSELEIGTIADGSIYAHRRNNFGTVYQINDPTGPKLGVEVTVVAIFLLTDARNSRMTLYVNGVAVADDGSVYSSVTMETLDRFSIGARADNYGGINGRNFYTGTLGNALLFGRALSDAEIRSISENMNQVFAAPVREVFVSSAQIEATVTWAEISDTFIVAGSVQVIASAAMSEQSDTFAASAMVRTLASLAWTDQPDATSIAGSVTAGAAAFLAWTEALDTSALLGTVRVNALIGFAEASDTYSVSAQILAAAGIAWAEASDLTAINGSISAAVQAAMIGAEASDTHTISGTSGAQQIINPAAIYAAESRIRAYAGSARIRGH